MILRDATFDDLPHLLPLLEELGYPTHLDSLEMRYELFLKNPGNSVVLYEKKIQSQDSFFSTENDNHEYKNRRGVGPVQSSVINDEKRDQVQILGFMAWSKSHLIISDVTRFHIEALVVSSEHHRQGIAKMLLRYVEEIARSFAPSLIDLTSGKRRAKAGTHEFYKQLGYTNDGPVAKVYLRKEFKN